MFTEHSLRIVNYEIGKEVELSKGEVRKAWYDLVLSQMFHDSRPGSAWIRLDQPKAALRVPWR